jgi:hypothetical protein
LPFALVHANTITPSKKLPAAHGDAGKRIVGGRREISPCKKRQRRHGADAQTAAQRGEKSAPQENPAGRSSF